jgi:predicted outer membrane repeat protein
MLESSIAAATGKAVLLNLSTSFEMTGYSSESGYSGIAISGEGTAVTEVIIDGHNAVLDANHSGRFFSVTECGTLERQLTVSNVHFKNGARGDSESQNGGAILVSCPGGFANVILTNCTFSENVVRQGKDENCGNGGAIYVDGISTVNIDRCSFSANMVGSNPCGGSGGAIYVGDGIVKVTMTSCSFSANTADVYAKGGAIYVHDGSNGGNVMLVSCSFSANVASSGGEGSGGGAIAFASANVLIVDCHFEASFSNGTNDILYLKDSGPGNLTFACPPGFSGSSVQMQGSEISVIPPKALKCTAEKPTPSPSPLANEYRCINNICVPSVGGIPKAECEKVCGTPSLYICKNSTCIPATSGVNKSTCEQFCR